MGRKEEIGDDQGDRDTGVGPMAWVFKPTSAFACGFGSFSYPIFLNLCFSCDSIDYLHLRQAMGLHLLMLLNRRSHLLALECLMEPEDSQWDEVGLLSQIRVSM